MPFLYILSTWCKTAICNSFVVSRYNKSAYINSTIYNEFISSIFLCIQCRHFVNVLDTLQHDLLTVTIN